MQVRYRDDAPKRARVRLPLYRRDLNTGQQTPIPTFDSNERPSSATSTIENVVVRHDSDCFDSVY